VKRIRSARGGLPRASGLTNRERELEATALGGSADLAGFRALLRSFLPRALVSIERPPIRAADRRCRTGKVWRYDRSFDVNYNQISYSGSSRRANLE